MKIQPAAKDELPAFEIRQDACDICGAEAMCLASDATHGEYSEGKICKRCITVAFAEAEAGR